ncbi:ABC transporter ATP-binding protein/permease [Fictibacillus nanhaiensis]|uniref:ABC transporter ATP-binding protein n=1 Tax=Fictibacillus nanhaiensis TaxID=742169 RepID=UPI001C93E85E|nr:ABC transporter ATP-binding protein [Fictibacillus nanhaiensis]MBY6036465.1 ABC transporter ATP-binding protein/permease [Fictibacillus nanhaiensis]
MKETKKSDRFRYSSEQVIDKPFNWKQIIRLFGFMKPYSKNLLPKAFLAMIVTTAVRLAVPVFIGVLTFDHAIKNKDTSLLVTLIFVILGLYLVSWGANTLRIRWMNYLGQYVIYDIRQHLFKHIQRLSHRFFDQRSAGSILVRIINDVNSLQDLFTNGVINVLMDIILLFGIIVIMFVYSPELTLAIMVILPLMFFISTSLRKKIRRSWQVVRIKQAKLNSHLNESIQGIRVTKSYTQEKQNMEFFNGVNNETYDSWKTATQQNALFRPFVEMSNAIGTAILLWYLGMFWEPISRLGQVYNQLLVGMASSERIFEFLDERPNVHEKKDAYVFKRINGEIQFDSVEFSYDHTRKALKGIDLSIEAGQTVAFVGHTGSGKTTIANLVSRFYDPTRGDVLIDGVNLKDANLASLRKKVSVVLQDTFIFSGTIKDNIRFGRPDASDDEVKEASIAVGAHGFIQKLSNGYETEVEERGNVLSVGERQLLSFARALLADPDILILDEATASIDTESEQKIQTALKTLLKGRTAIIIAHRLSTIREADNIVVLDHGEIIEQGNHEELMSSQGVYYQLVVSQFKMLDAI